MKELSIEEKAKAYDKAIAHAKILLKTIGSATLGYLVLKNEFENMFPELKESEDERIRKEIISTIHLYYGEPLENEAKEMIAWLEKQGGHAKFINGIQVGDKVTRNEDGVLVNLSQLNRVAKKQGEQKPVAWSEEDEYRLSILEALCDDQINSSASYSTMYREMHELKDWLKSLKERYNWKSSDLPHWKKSTLPNDNTTGFNSDYFCHKGYCINYKELFEKLPKDD